MRFLSVIHPRASQLAPTMLASALFACSAAACGGTPSGAEDAANRTPSPNQGIIAGMLEVKADRNAKSLTLRNTTAFEVGYMVVEKDMMTVALFPPCGEQCPILPQGATTMVKYTAIAGYSEQAREARVMWWSYKRNADGTRTPQGAVNTVNVVL